MQIVAAADQQRRLEQIAGRSRRGRTPRAARARACLTARGVPATPRGSRPRGRPGPARSAPRASRAARRRDAARDVKDAHRCCGEPMGVRPGLRPGTDTVIVVVTDGHSLLTVTIIFMSLSVSDPRSLGVRRWWALGAVSLAVLAVGLDGTVLSVAMPTLATRCTRRSPTCSGSRRLPAGAGGGDAADGAARRPLRPQEGACWRRWCSSASARRPAPTATTAGAFIAARVVLGLAGAGIIVMALSALTVLFTEEERPRAVGDLGAPPTSWRCRSARSSAAGC